MVVAAMIGMSGIFGAWNADARAYDHQAAVTASGMKAEPAGPAGPAGAGVYSYDVPTHVSAASHVPRSAGDAATTPTANSRTATLVARTIIGSLPWPSTSLIALSRATKAGAEAGRATRFVTTPRGTTFDIPKGWAAREADNGKGIVYQQPGAEGNVDSIRIMEPTAKYPKGLLPLLQRARPAVERRGQARVEGQRRAWHVRLQQPRSAVEVDADWRRVVGEL